MFNEKNQIHYFMSSSGSGTVINYGSGSGSDFLTSYSSGYGYGSYGSGSGSGSTTLWYWHTICSSPANGKQGPIPDEMSQSLLTNKKQGNLD